METVYPLLGFMSTHFIPLHRLKYVFRVTVPRSLAPYFRRRQIWRSLKTSDKDRARLRAAQFTVHFQTLFLKLKAEGAFMTPTEIETLVARWLAAEVITIEESLASTSKTESWYEGAELVWDDQYSALHERMASCDYRAIAPEVQTLLHGAGLPPLQHDSVEFKQLCRRMLRAKLELVAIERARSHGVYSQAPSLVMSPTPKAPPVAASPLFSEAARKYLKEKPRAPRTVKQVEVEYGKFLAAIGGDRPVAQITKSEGRLYKDSLIQRGLKPATVAIRLHVLSGLFTWAAKQGYTPEGASHPIRGLAPERAERERHVTEIRPFTEDELLHVFATPKFVKQRLPHPERYWVTLICLFQLCRREEAAQLTLKDIGEKDGIPFMVITDLGEHQSVKTPGSKRTIPIHSSLIELGFLDYVQAIKRTKYTRLFHQLPLIAHRFGDAVGKWFGNHLDRVGLSQPELVMHSLRHGIHYLHALGCPQDVAEMLTGHTASTVHNKYEHRNLTPLPRLRDGLERMQFKDVVEALSKA